MALIRLILRCQLFICFIIIASLTYNFIRSEIPFRFDQSSTIQKLIRKHQFTQFAFVEDPLEIETSEETKEEKIEYGFTNFKRTNLRDSYGEDITILEDVISYISDSAYLMIKDVEYAITKNLSLNQDPDVLQDILNNVGGSTELYVNFMYEQIVNCELEREFYILHFIDSVTNLLTNQSYVFLNKTLRNLYEKSVEDYEIENEIVLIKKYIKNAVTNEKSDNFRHICEKLNICHKYPGFSDSIAEILNEFIELPFIQFQYLIKLLNNITETQASFLVNIVDVNIIFTQDQKSKLSYLENKLDESRELLVTLKHIIYRRHAIFKSKDGEIKIKTKALRILIDLFDKSFETMSSKHIRDKVDYVIDKARVWSYDVTFDFEGIFTVFIDSVVKVLSNFLELPGVKTEVKALIDIIVYGSIKYKVDGDLFTKGSKFLNHRKYDVWDQNLESNSLEKL